MTTTSDDKNWRQLCAQAAVETDPRRLLEIIDQLIKALDDRRDELRRSGQYDVGLGPEVPGK